MLFLTNLDLNQNELQNVILQPLASHPTNGKEGQIYYNSTDKMLYRHNGTAWVRVGATYDMSLGALSSNAVPINLVGSDGTTDAVTIKGAGGATLSKSGNTLTITTANTNTTYTFTGAAVADKYTITITPSGGTATTITIPLATADAAGLMSPAHYLKLAGIAEGANKTTVDSALSSTSTNPVQNKAIYAALGNKVDKVEGKGLSSNDFTTDEKYKLSDIEEFAEENKIDTIQLNGKTLAINNKLVNIEIPKEQFLDQAKTAFVNSFSWSTTLYPGSTNPGLNGKPVLVLAVKDEEGNVTYSFLNMHDLVETYTGDGIVVVSGNSISHKTYQNGEVGAGPSEDTGLNFGDDIKVPLFKVDKYGHVTTIEDKFLTLPSNNATSSKAGLMSTSDKSKVDKMTYGTATIAAGSTSVSVTKTSSQGLYSYQAFLGTEAVLIDAVDNGTTAVFGISVAQSSAVSIKYVLY